jgi:tetratricopeptide (TPR) repeat protein
MALQQCIAVIALAGLSALAGCSGSGRAQNPQEAKKQWMTARSGVVYGVAQQQFSGGDLDNCRKSLDESLKLDPTNVRAHVLSARVEIERGKLELAEKELQYVRELDGANAQAYYLSGVVYQRWRRPATALEMYSKAAELQPAELAYLLARAEMLVAMDRVAEALAVLKDRVVYFENSAAIRDAVGQVLAQLGRGAEATEFFRQAHMLAADDPVIAEHLALSLLRTGKHAEAAQLLARMVREPRLARRADLLLALGQCQLHLGKAADARETFESATQLDPASFEAWLSLAKAALQLDDLRRADLSIAKAMALEPANSEGALLLGYLRLRQNRLDHALAAFRTASSANPAETVALCMVGYVLEKMGRPDEAIACYAQALRMRPNDELAAKLMAQSQPGRP